jgi:hypothetical protein
MQSLHMYVKKNHSLQLNKRKTYFASLGVVVVICLLYQCIWIFSRTARAEYLGYEKDQRGAYWMIASYQVNYETYRGKFLQDGFNSDNRFFEIRYLIFSPDLARSNTFVSNWGPLILIFIFMTLVISIVFARNDIIANQAVFQFQKTRPFIQIVHNEVKDIEGHDIEKENLDETQQVLRNKLLQEEKTSAPEEVYANVYKYNPNAIGIIIVYIIFLSWFIIQLLSLSMGYGGIIFFGAVALFIPPYIQNTKNPVFKMKIPDERKLVFSFSGIKAGETTYRLSEIESAVIYLESFAGFKYRERTTTGMSATKCNGDNNKISFRCNGEVYDYTFILSKAADYWAFKNVMTSWSAKGVTMIFQKVFEDDYIIQEMVHFNDG